MRGWCFGKTHKGHSVADFPIKGGVAVITGAASGIGAALAADLAAKGCHLALCDRNTEGLARNAAAARLNGVTVSEQAHSWRSNPWNAGNAALQTGELIELFVIGTAVVPMPGGAAPPRPVLVISANDAPAAEGPGGGER